MTALNVIGVTKQQVLARVPDAHPHRILTLNRSDFPRGTAKGDTFTVALEGPITNTAAGYGAPLTILERVAGAGEVAGDPGEGHQLTAEGIE